MADQNKTTTSSSQPQTVQIREDLGKGSRVVSQANQPTNTPASAFAAQMANQQAKK